MQQLMQSRVAELRVRFLSRQAGPIFVLRFGLGGATVFVCNGFPCVGCSAASPCLACR